MADEQKPQYDIIVTPMVRLAFPNLAEPRAMEEGQTPKYQATLLFDEEAQASKEFKRIKKAVEKAVQDKWGDQPPKKLRRPFLTTDDLNNVPDGYEDEHVIVRCNTTIQPGCVDSRNQPVLNVAETFYPGAWVRAAVHAFAWSHKTGGNGVSISLDHIQFAKDGEPFGRRTKPTDVFESMDDDDDEDDEDEDGL